MLLFIFFCYFYVISGLHTNDLRKLIILYRHGDRTPVDPYPTDPYRNRSYWPVDFGELTNLGKQQHYELGRWLRHRYANYLPLIYTERDIYVRATDVDRTLMSAESNLAGLYPPITNQIWNPLIKWQPIPVHTRPEKMDPILAGKKLCPHYDKLYHETMKNDPFLKNITKKNEDLFQYLTQHTGTTVHNLATLEFIYNTLFIETIYNLTLPAWTHGVYPEKMEKLAGLSFATQSYTPQLARLKIGLLLDEWMTYLRDVNNTLKVRIYSAHDTTVANVLMGLGAFEPHSPPYTSTILIELYQNNLINIFYKNTTNTIYNITVKGCQFNCHLNDMIEILQPILIQSKRWDYECRLGLVDLLDDIDRMKGGAVVGILLFCILLLVGLVWRFRRQMEKKDGKLYMQLADEDLA